MYPERLHRSARRFIARLLLSLATLHGCSSQPSKFDEKPPGEYPTLPGRFAEEGVRQPLVAEEAFIGDREFFVRYESADGLIDEFEARLLIDKPADYSVVESFDFAEFMLRARPQLKAFLQAEGITARRILFNTGDTAVEMVRPTWLITLESQPLPEVAEVPPMDLRDWERQLDTLTGRPATKGIIDYLIDGEQYFTRLIDAITSARESILIRTYIFDNDDYAEKIGRLLRRRSKEGVEVKVLIDGLGTILATGVDDASMPADYQAPESVRRFLEEDSDIEVRQVKNPWLAGDHVKTTIIDETIAFTGGMNIGREYRYVWHDIMMEARAPSN